MANRLKWSLLGGLVLALGWTATSCSGLLPPALYPSPAGAVGSLAPGAAVVSFRGEIVPVLRQHCASCHSTGGIGAAKLVMFDAAGEVQYATVRTRIRDMIGAVKDGRMPLGKPNSVPPADVAKLEAWLAAGTPDTAAVGSPGAVTSPGAPVGSAVPGATPSAPVGATPAPGATVTPGAAVGTTLSYRTQVVPILRQHCASCHVTGGIGPFAMFDAGQEPVHATIRTQLPAMITAIKNGRMPLGRPGTVPADQVATLEAWQAAGAPEADVTVPGAPVAGSADPGAATPTPAVVPTPVVVAPTPVPGFSPAPLPSVAGAVSFTTQVVPILRQHCASCHVTGGIGPFSMFNAAGEPQFFTIQGRIADMVNAIQAGRMPLGRPGSVPADQVATLDAWRAAGAPGDVAGPAPGATPPVASLPPTTAAPTATPAAVIPSAVPIDLAAVQFTRDVVPVLRQHCVACHVTGGFAPWAMFDTGGAPFFNNIKTRMPAMIDAIKTGRMPMNRPGTVSANHLGVLEAWQAAGGPADPTPPVGATPTPAPAPSIVPTVNNVSFRTHVVPILNQHCSACHTQGGQGAGKVRMFLSTGAADWTVIRGEIDDMLKAIREREMPLGRPGTVPAGQIQTLQNWATRGAPNN